MNNGNHLLPVIFLLCILSFPAHAMDGDFSGLAMHGAPKYGPGDTHLDYANPDAPKGGTLKQSAPGTFDTLNPFSIKGTAAAGLDLTYDRLSARVWDEPFTLYPLIADRFDVPEDRSSLTVHINPKARFHDGSAITADDILFSFKTLKTHGRPNMRRVYKLAKEAEKLDAHTVKFTFSNEHDRETVMIFAMMPVLAKKWWEGRTFDSTTLDIPLTGGPYRIAVVDPGRGITYERVPDYWAKDLPTVRGHYNFDKMTYEYYRDDTVALEAFKTGDSNLRREWDAGAWVGGAYDFPAVKDGRVILEDFTHGRPDKVRAFIFNTRRAPFDDIRVREALSLLFDADWVNRNLFHGKYRRITSFFPNTDLAAPQTQDKITDRRTALRRADMLLKDAGWIVRDGKRVDEVTGEPLAFDIILGSAPDEKIALALTRNLERMGIKPQVRVLDSAAFFGRLNEYDYDMVLHHWMSTLSPGTEQYLYWSCEAAEQPSRWNYAGICDPEIDRLAEEIARSRTREDLIQKTRALDSALMAGQYMIPLYYNPRDFIAYWKPLAHPQKTPLYGPVLETWWMDDAKSDQGR